MRAPQRILRVMYGAPDMDSQPPTSSIWSSPERMIWEPSEIARIDDAQTLLSVMAGVVSGRPAPTMTWRATFWPTPPCRTWPKMTSSIASLSTPARSMAAFAVAMPKTDGCTSRRVPP